MTRQPNISLRLMTFPAADLDTARQTGRDAIAHAWTGSIFLNPKGRPTRSRVEASITTTVREEGEIRFRPINHIRNPGRQLGHDDRAGGEEDDAVGFDWYCALVHEGGARGPRRVDLSGWRWRSRRGAIWLHLSDARTIRGAFRLRTSHCGEAQRCSRMTERCGVKQVFSSASRQPPRLLYAEVSLGGERRRSSARRSGESSSDFRREVENQLAPIARLAVSGTRAISSAVARSAASRATPFVARVRTSPVLPAADRFSEAMPGRQPELPRPTCPHLLPTPSGSWDFGKNCGGHRCDDLGKWP